MRTERTNSVAKTKLTKSHKGHQNRLRSGKRVRTNKKRENYLRASQFLIMGTWVRRSEKNRAVFQRYDKNFFLSPQTKNMRLQTEQVQEGGTSQVVLWLRLGASDKEGHGFDSRSRN